MLNAYNFKGYAAWSATLRNIKTIKIFALFQCKSKFKIRHLECE